MGKVKLYSKLILAQFKTKLKKPREYEIPRCGISFTKMTKLADEIKGIKIVKDQDTKATTFKVNSKSPEIIFSFVSQMTEFIMTTAGSPSKKDQKRINELGAYIKKIEPLMTNLDLYKEASTLMG